MYLGFTTFTLLWIISCTALYFGLIRKNEMSLQKVIEANKLYEDAKLKNAQAQQALEKALLRLQQIEQSLNCPN